jgi:uncharacterized membrane protein
MEEGTVEIVRGTVERAAAAGWLRLAHVFGVVAWAGGVLTVSRLLGGIVRAEEPARQTMAALSRRVYLGIAFPGLLLLLGAGLYILIADPEGHEYLKQPYMHIKLTVVLLLLVVDHMLVMRPLKALAKGGADPAGQEGLYRAGFWMYSLLLLVVLIALFVVRR